MTLDKSDKTLEYLGDGLYASCDGYMIRLFSHNGVRTLNEIWLEPQVYAALLKYHARLKL